MIADSRWYPESVAAKFLRWMNSCLWRETDPSPGLRSCDEKAPPQLRRTRFIPRFGIRSGADPHPPPRSETHFDAPKCISTLRNALRRSETHFDAPKRISTLRNAFRRSEMHFDAPKRTSTLRNAFRRSETHFDAPKRVWLNRHSPWRTLSERVCVVKRRNESV